MGSIPEDLFSVMGIPPKYFKRDHAKANRDEYERLKEEYERRLGIKTKSNGLPSTRT